MSANRLRMICSKMFSKNFHFREKVAHFQFLVFEKKVSKPNFNFFVCSLYVLEPFSKIENLKKLLISSVEISKSTKLWGAS